MAYATRAPFLDTAAIKPDMTAIDSYLATTLPGDILAVPGATTVAYAASITPAPTLAAPIVKVGTLTGNLTVNAVASPATWQSLILILYQDATGGRTVTWHAQYRNQPPLAVNTGPNQVTVVSLLFDGTSWI